jgi:hypothetical protein
MIFDQVSASQMRAARIFAGAAMAGFIAAPLFRRQARKVRLAVAGTYVAGVIGFAVYALS